MNKEKLNQILENHQHWLRHDCEGWERMRADLSGMDLRCEELGNSNLCGANLSGAKLWNANLIDIDLSHANLSNANLYGANLRGANLRNANLCGADLRGADLYCADLHGADLSKAKLHYTELSYTNLTGVDFSDVDFYNTELYGADLCCASLDSKEMIRKGIKLSEDMIGWKKCEDNVIVKLLIPRGAIVFSINNNKCRTDKAKVLEVIGGVRGISRYKYMSYYVGDRFEVFDFNCEYNKECAKGIHFFRTREEAENYFCL